MNDLEEDLSRSLAATAADTDVHVERLLDHALTAGTRYRRRRRVLAGAGTALAAGLGVALVVGAVSLGLPRSGAGTGIQAAASGKGTPQPSVQPTPRESAFYSSVPQLVLANGAPSVLQAPSQLGDPRYLHVSIDPGTAYGKLVEWGAFGDYETLSVNGDDGPNGGFTLTLAASTRDMGTLDGTLSTVTVNGHSGQFAVATSDGVSSATLRWQPAPALWAQLVGNLSAETAQHLAESIRFDRTYLCPTSFQVLHPPAGASRVTCVVTVLDGVAAGRAEIAVGSWDVAVEVMPLMQLDNPNTTLGGHPAQVQETTGDGGHKILQIVVDYGPGHVVTLTGEGPFDAAAVRAIAGNLQFATDPDPAHWPTSPLP